MKPLTLGLLVALGLFGIGCGAEPDEETAPPPAQAARVAGSVERKLTSPIPAPTDTGIGGSIDALVEGQTALEAQTALVAREPVVNLGANGKRCTSVRFDDENGVEQMRRDQCGTATDTLRIGKLVYKDTNGDRKIDQVSELGAATYEVFDDDGDGKVDRIVESAERIKTPISLADFGDSVTIMGDGKIASRERADKDHDGKFDIESVTATTSFKIAVTPKP